MRFSRLKVDAYMYEQKTFFAHAVADLTYGVFAEIKLES